MLSPAMTLGSSVRAKGILQEMQARLPAALKKAISLEGNEITLAMPARDKNAFDAAARTVAGVMMEAETLPAHHLPCLRSEGGRGPSRSRARGRVAGGGRRGEGRETTESGLSEAAGSIAQKEVEAGRKGGSKGRRRCGRPSWMGRVRSGWVPSVGNRAKRGASSDFEKLSLQRYGNVLLLSAASIVAARWVDLRGMEGGIEFRPGHNGSRPTTMWGKLLIEGTNRAKSPLLAQ